MGCSCISSKLKDKYNLEDIISTEYNSSKKEIISIYPLTSYVKNVFYLINKIRTNPSGFIKAIEQAEKFIKEINGRKIFWYNDIKIALNEGISMFNDCKNYLNSIQPMDEINFCDEIVLECPTEENKIKEKNYFKEKILEKKDKCGIKAYFRDSIYIPEISVLLMIVDDSSKNPRKKRECLLNPNFKYIGISASDYINNNNENNIIINTKEDNNENNAEKNNEGNEKNNGGNIYNNEDRFKEEKININTNNESKRKAFCAYFTLK